MLLLLLIFSVAKSKPIVAEPEIHGGQSLDGVTGFLLLMSEGLIKALEAAHGPEQANQVCSCDIHLISPHYAHRVVTKKALTENQ